MKRSILLILACIFIIPFIARSQNEGIKQVANPLPVEKQAMQTRSTQEMAMIQEQGTTGGAPMPSGIASQNSPLFLEPGWVAGNVYLNDFTSLKIVMLRYDIYHQQIQFIKDQDTLAFANPEEVNYFEMGDKKLIYTDYEENGVKGKSYFEVISEGGCRLLLHRSITYHIDEESADNVKDEIYIRESDYFIEKKNDIAKPIRACRKGVLCAFKDKEDQVKDYMDVNDLKMTTCEDLKQVVEYYNSLP